MKKRKGNSKAENEGLNYIRTITNREGHIFREILKDDVGIDAEIEFCQNDDEPSGILIGVQIKTGESYIRSESDDSFTFYPSLDDLKYWNDYSLPVYLIIYRPEKDIAYWSDIKDQVSNYNFEDIISGITPKKIIINKTNSFTKNFFTVLKRKCSSLNLGNLYNQFLQNIMNTSSIREGLYSRTSFEFFNFVDVKNGKKMLQYLNDRHAKLVNELIKAQGWENEIADSYINELIVRTRSIIFEKESTGFLLFTFREKEDRDKVLKCIEEIIPFNKYLILEGEMMMPFLCMNYSILIASNCWHNGHININSNFHTNLENKFGLKWNITYDIGYYDSLGASRFLNAQTNLSSNPGYIFYTAYDTKDDYFLFDYLRLHPFTMNEQESNKYIWASIGKDRIRVTWDWDPAIFSFFIFVLKIRNGDELSSYDLFILELEFEICTKEETNWFIEKVKAANSLKELPFMECDFMIDSLKSGIESGDIKVNFII